MTQHRTGRYEPSTAEMGTQSEFCSMMTQTNLQGGYRIVLARTPMPSSMNLTGSIPTANVEELIEAIQGAGSLTDSGTADMAVGMHDENDFVSQSLPTSIPISAPIAIPKRIHALRDSATSPEDVLHASSSPPQPQFLEVRIPGSSPSQDESSV